MSMNCEDARLLISILSEEGLPARDKALLSAHLGGCPSCSAYQHDMACMQAKLADCLDADDYCGDIADIVMSQLPVPTPRPRLALKPAWLLIPGLGALAVALILANSASKKPQTQLSKSMPKPVPQVQKHEMPGKPSNNIAKAPHGVTAGVSGILFPTPSIPSSTPASMDPAGSGAHKHIRHSQPPAVHQNPVPQPREIPQEPVVVKDTPPAQPPVIASAPADDPEGPMPGRVHLETPRPTQDEYIRVASSELMPCMATDPPKPTTAYVCVDVPAVNGVEEVRLYRIPIQAPRRPVALAYHSQQEMPR